MVNLTRICTRTGDAGDAHLLDNAEVPKTDLRVEAYEAIDKISSSLILAIAHGGLPGWVMEVLALVRNELFDVGVGPSVSLHPSPQHPPLRVEQSSIDRLEEWCDELGAELPSLRSFVLPGGSPAAAQLHVARTVCRRVEWVTWRAAQIHSTEPSAGRDEGGANLLAITYLNRLSDLLFNTYRIAAGPGGNVLWVPGTDCQPSEKCRSRTKK